MATVRYIRFIRSTVALLNYDTYGHDISSMRDILSFITDSCVIRIVRIILLDMNVKQIMEIVSINSISYSHNIVFARATNSKQHSNKQTSWSTCLSINAITSDDSQ